jgi:hypothetical protein
MNTIPPQTIVLTPKRYGLQLAGDTTNKLEGKPEHKPKSKSVVISYRAGRQQDCTRMVDFL